MNIHNPNALWLLLLIPLFIWLAMRHGRRFSRKFKRFASEDFQEIFLGAHSPFYAGLKLVLLTFAFGILVFALARPQWDFRPRELETGGMDIIFAIDVSRSMEATDISPNRLLRSILQISAFVDKLGTDRVGIISFAGASVLECPLTDDHEAIKMVLSGLSTDSAVKEGTNIGSALDLAAKSFDSGFGNQVFILISDGEDIPGSALSKARDLSAKGVRIYTMGVGSASGAVVRNPITGAEHLSRLDEAMLSRIAKTGGGQFYHVTPSANEISLMLSNIYQSEQEQFSRRSIPVYKEQYHLFILIALVFIVLESFISQRKRKRV